MSESSNWIGGLFSFAWGAGLGAVAGTAGGAAIVYVAMSGIYLGDGTSAGAGLFLLSIVFYLAVAGACLGLVAMAFRRTGRSGSGLTVGTVVGYAPGLLVAWLANRIVAANSHSASENSDVLLGACLGSLACIAAGAILGAIHPRWIAVAFTIDSQRKRSFRKRAVAVLIVSLSALAGWLYWPFAPERQVFRLLHEIPTSPRHSRFGVPPLLTRSSKAIQADLDALGPGAVPALIEAAADPGEGFGRNCAARQLARLKDPRAVDVLVQCVQERPVRVREAFQALGQIRDPRAVEPLLVCLEDDDASVQTLAAHALAGIGDSRTCAPLLAILTDEGIRNEEAEPRRQWEPRESVRIPAALGLAHCRDERTVDLLLAILEDETDDLRVRASAAQALGKIGDPRAIPALSRAAQGPRPREGSLELHQLTRDAAWALQMLNRNRPLP